MVDSKRFKLQTHRPQFDEDHHSTILVRNQPALELLGKVIHHIIHTEKHNVIPPALPHLHCLSWINYDGRR